MNYLIEGKVYNYYRGIDRNQKRTHNKSKLDGIIKTFTNEYVDEWKNENDGSTILIKKEKPMPVFANYGVNRAVMDMPKLETGRNYKKTDAFENAIESKIDFKSFFLWFRQQEDLENEMIAKMKQVNIENMSLPTLEAVRKAMLSMFPSFSSVRFDRQLNTLVFEKNNQTLNINQLSDGEKCIIALFGDIARRMAIANDNILLDPLQLGGVILIDEVDLHLHPSWQREIANLLHDTFPNIQFILTTHSPQVLGTLDKEYKVFSVGKDSEGTVTSEESYYGWDSNIILEEAMGTTSVAKDVFEHIDMMYEAYDNGDLEKASEEADWVDNITRGHNESVSGMRVMIARKRRMSKNEEN